MRIFKIPRKKKLEHHSIFWFWKNLLHNFVPGKFAVIHCWDFSRLLVTHRLDERAQPPSQGSIRTTLAQSNDSSILIGRQFFIPNSNELLKIVGDANSVSPISTAPPQQTQHRKNSLAGGVMSFLILLTCGSTTSHDSTMDYSRE